VGGVGLVLGAGGVVGQAYHAGVLAALEHDCHWDARAVDVIVGTSAGSITGSLLRNGVPATELAAWIVKAPLSREGRRLRRILGTEIPDFEPYGVGHVLRAPSLPGREMLIRAVIRPWHFRPLAAALALLAPGRLDILDQLAALREVEALSWPDRDLWICAVRRRDGRRVVFGRPGTPPAPLHLAIAASCAVPGYFAPVDINGHTYVDGGAHSPTNAAILRGRSLDLVIVISPMSGPTPQFPTNLYEGLRWHAARMIRREGAARRASGTNVVVFRPGPAELEAMGNDFMSRQRVDKVVQQAFFAAGAYAARPEVRELLSGLGQTPARRKRNGLHNGAIPTRPAGPGPFRTQE
jgi:NTE family protein